MNDYGAGIKCPKCQMTQLQPTKADDGTLVFICACGYGKDLLKKKNTLAKEIKNMQTNFCVYCKQITNCNEKNTFHNNWNCGGFKCKNPFKKIILKLCRWVGIQTIYDKNKSNN